MATAMPIQGLRNRTGFSGVSRLDPDARVAVATVAVKKPGQRRPVLPQKVPLEIRPDRRRRQSTAGPSGNSPPAYLACFFTFFARRASRYFLIVAFGRSLCFAQTIPKTGAARLAQPGTGQS